MKDNKVVTELEGLHSLNGARYKPELGYLFDFCAIWRIKYKIYFY